MEEHVEPAQTAAEVDIQVVDEIDDRKEERDPQHACREDADELDRHVAIQDANGRQLRELHATAPDGWLATWRSGRDR